MGWGIPVTTDEELNLLEQQLRRLKIEYEIFFNNPTKRPPTEIEWKVNSLLRKFSDGARLSFSQRFRYNEMAQRYAVQSDLWRKKVRIREEGCRRPQDALLSVQGAQLTHSEAERRPVYGLARHGQNAGEDQRFSVECSGAAVEQAQVESLYRALAQAKEKTGEKISGDLDSFATFVKKKTSEIRKQQGCETVVYSVEMQGGHVRLKAKGKKS